jgi:hypothetical protein
MAFIGNQIITINSLLDLDGQELVLDADADSTIHVSTDDQIDFKIGGTDVATFTNSSSDFVITQAVQDKDIIFKGDDGGSAITALTLDMSEAGNASFNGTVTANAGVVVDNITIDGTEIDLSSGDLTVDVAGDIILDADGGDFQFKDGGTHVLNIENSSGDIKITSITNDKDIIFRGVDNSSAIDALTLDMSDAGTAQFAHDIELVQSNFINFKHQAGGTIRATISADSSDNLTFGTGSSGTERMRIDTSGNVGIGTTSPDADLTIPSPSFGSGGTGNGIRFQNTNNDADAIIQSYYSGTSASALLHGQNLYLATNASFTNFDSSKASSYILQNTDGQILFANASSSAPSERMRIDSSGNLLIGHTSQDVPVDNGGAGVTLRPAGIMLIGGTGTSIFANREDSDGTIVELRKDGGAIGRIGTVATSYPFIGTTSGGDVGMAFIDEQVRPVNGGTGANADDTYDLGNSAVRWRDIYTNGAVTTSSDQNEKQDIASLTAKELKVATKLSALFKTYRWKDRVVEKGDKARTHSGIIAQDIQSAFSAEGLDASKYGMFISNTWWEKDNVTYNTKEEAPSDANEKTRLAVRYTELFSFIFSSIEARLTALESA